MKKLLLIAGFVLSSVYVNAQATCTAAAVIAAPGTTVSPAITGTYGNPCWGGANDDAGAPLKSNWYAYTAPSNGEVTVSSVLAINPVATTDTRLSIFSGTCTALVCLDGNDDINGAISDYRSEVTFPASAGTTYYIAWDSYWSTAGFSFSVAFAPGGCIRPSSLAVDPPTNPTVSGITLSWDPAIGAPAGYDVDYGAVGHIAGTGTIAYTSTNSITLSGLPVSADLDYYLRSNCGATQSAWVGPFDVYLAEAMPYANNFDTVGDNLDGFVLSTGFNLSTSATNAAYAGTPPAFLFSNTSPTVAANAFAFFRPVALASGESVTINFTTRFLANAFDAASLNVTVGTAPTSVAQTTVVASFPSIAGADTFHTARVATWTAPAAGIYYFAFHHNSAAMGTAAASLIVDSVSATSILSVNEVLSNKFVVYPNPTTGLINVSNSDNIRLNKITVTDLNGRVVKSNNYDNLSDTQLNVSDLSAGMYLLTISSDQGTAVKKIVKN